MFSQQSKLIIWFDKSLNLENKCSMHVESALLIVLQQEIGIGRLSQRRLLYLCSCVTFWAQVVHPYSLLPLQQKRAQNSEPNRKYIKHHIMLGEKRCETKFNLSATICGHYSTNRIESEVGVLRGGCHMMP